MRELGLEGKRKGIIRKKTTNSNHALEIAQKKLERQFKTEKPNQKWVADLTYIPTLEGWLFLREPPVRCCFANKKAVVDLFSRKIVGWSMSESLETKVILNALEMARSSRNPAIELLHHSDRGVQYSAGVHRLVLEKFGAISSRKGNCWDSDHARERFRPLAPKPVGCCFKGKTGASWNQEGAFYGQDNTVAESLFGTLKCELDLDKPIGSVAETRGMVFEWIEVWYNRERRHSSLGFLSPVVFEERHQTLFSVSTKS